MKQTTILLLLALFTFTGTAAFAQADKHKERQEKIEAAKTAFLTDKMGLSPEQSQKFWPLYNEYEARRHDLYTSSNSLKRVSLNEMSEQEIKTLINNRFERDQKVLNLEKEYAAKFQRVISTRQLAQLYRAEHEFTKLLLRRLDGKHAQQ
ncbi:hypothetical protein I2I11_05020 [Pontibacter sp. 172403-2]|uniref:hypothetical protein n=1 Tax=Pontibacter rufus TaxID=2791028 RepID=UPI0018AFCA56|nr:hypothetical protein [Pontibacter sp. 172403-2]MBF9252645.1 hypothetical protein [Pontibacter sp. 172403-2]